MKIKIVYNYYVCTFLTKKIRKYITREKMWNEKERKKIQKRDKNERKNKENR